MCAHFVLMVTVIFEEPLQRNVCIVADVGIRQRKVADGAARNHICSWSLQNL